VTTQSIMKTTLLQTLIFVTSIIICAAGRIVANH